MKRLLLFLPLIIILLLVGVFLRNLSQDPTIVPFTLLNHPLPSFKLQSLPGQPGFSSADLQNTHHVSLLNIFASWCVPCIAEMPQLKTLQQEPGLALYAIAYKDKPEAVLASLHKYGNPFQAIGMDPNSRVALDLGITGVPETFIIDRQGLIRYHHAGPLTPDVVEKEILPLVRELKK